MSKSVGDDEKICGICTKIYPIASIHNCRVINYMHRCLYCGIWFDNDNLFRNHRRQCQKQCGKAYLRKNFPQTCQFINSIKY